MALLDLIKLAQDNFHKREQIFKGIANNIANEIGLLSEEKKAVIAKRVEICEGCEYGSNNVEPENYAPAWKGTRVWHCTKCGCALGNKTACFDNDSACECPIQKWLRYQEPKVNEESGVNNG
jgi:hypothetical protein